jgi:hypothetical protein
LKFEALIFICQLFLKIILIMAIKKLTPQQINSAKLQSERLKKIKEFGYLKDIKPTKANPLTTNQKAKILSEFKKLEPLINSGRDNFQKVSLKQYGDTTKSTFKEQGFFVRDDYVFLPKGNNDSISVKREFKKDKDGTLRLNIVATEKSGKKSGFLQESKVLLNATGRELDYEKRIEQSYKDLKIKDDEQFMVRLYKNGSFQNHIFDSLDGLFKYANDVFTPKHGDPKQTLLDNMHIVKVTRKYARNIQELIDEKKRVNKKINQSRKIRKATQGNLKRKNLKGAVNKK